METKDVFREIGQERGIPIGNGGTYLVGTIEGFPVCIAVGPPGSSEAVSITVRTGDGDFKALKKAIRGAKGMRASMLTNPGGSGFLRYVVPIWFPGRVKKAVITALDGLMPAVNAHFRAPAAACEICGRPGVENLVAEGGLPIRVCPGCIETIREKRAASRAAYEATSPAYLRGIILGLVGAAAGALSWAIVVVLLGRVHLIIAALIGVLVAYFVKKGMGRVDKAGYVIAGVLVLGAVFVGEIIAFAWPIFRETGSIDFRTAFQMYLDTVTDSPRALIVILFSLAGVWVGVVALKKIEEEARDRKIR